MRSPPSRIDLLEKKSDNSEQFFGRYWQILFASVWSQRTGKY